MSLKNPFDMERLAKELQEFCKLTFRNEAVDWQEVMEDEDYYDFFQRCHYINNKWADMVFDQLDKANLMQEELTFNEAVNNANKKLREEK